MSASTRLTMPWDSATIRALNNFGQCWQCSQWLISRHDLSVSDLTAVPGMLDPTLGVPQRGCGGTAGARVSEADLHTLRRPETGSGAGEEPPAPSRPSTATWRGSWHCPTGMTARPTGRESSGWTALHAGRRLRGTDEEIRVVLHDDGRVEILGADSESYPAWTSSRPARSARAGTSPSSAP